MTFLRFCAVGARGFLVDSAHLRPAGPNWSLLPYLTLSALGAFINFGIYLTWIHFFGATPARIVLGIACGAIIALMFNFRVSRHFVFRVG